MKNERLWTPTFIALTAANLIASLALYLLIVKIIQFASYTYGVSYGVAGIAVTTFSFSAMLTRILLGRKIDQWGLKKSILIGFACLSLAGVLYFVHVNFAFLLVVRVINGIGFALTTGSLAAAAALVVPSERRAEGIGYFTLSQAISTAIGPFAAVLLTQNDSSCFPIFVPMAVGSIVALIICSFLKLPEPAKKEPAEQTAASSNAQLAAHDGEANGETPASAGAFARLTRFVRGHIAVSVVPLGMVMVLTMICYSGVSSFITIFADTRDLAAAASVYFVVYALVILVSRPVMGRRVDKKGENSVIYPSLFILAAGYVVLAFSYHPAPMLVSAALIGFGIGTMQSVIQAVIVRYSSAENLGRANSTLLMHLDFGAGVGPVIIGGVVPFVDYLGCYLGLAFVALLACLLYHVVHGRKQHSRVANVRRVSRR